MKQRTSDFYLILLIGGLLGFAAACMLIFLPKVRETDFVERWQELLVGLLSLIAASSALYGVWRQIGQTQAIEDERRLRRLFAARVMLTHALGTVAVYARNCCDTLSGPVIHHANEAPKAEARISPGGFFQMPPVPDAPMMILKELLEDGSEDVQSAIAEFFVALQVQSNRAHLLQGQNFAADFYYELLADAVELYAHATALVSYARRKSETVFIPPTQGALFLTAKELGFSKEKWPLLFDRLKPDPSDRKKVIRIGD